MMEFVTKFIEELADKDPNTYFVGIDGYRFYMASNIQKKYPDRVIGAGISEQNAISIATGLTLSGKTVYVFMIAAYATKRALDQFKFACYCNANIRVITTLSGLSHPFAGYSHLAVDDVPIMKNTPNIEIDSPATIEEMEWIMNRSTTHKGPMYIADDCYGGFKSEIININNGIALSNKGNSKKILILYAGMAGYFLFKGPQIISKLKAYGINPDVYSIFKMYPLDESTLEKMMSKYKYVLTFELRGEGSLSSSIAEIIATSKLKTKLIPIRLNNEKYDITGYVDYVADKYMGINTLDEKILQILTPKSPLIKIVIKKYDKDTKIIYKLFNIPYYIIKKQSNKKIRHLLFGFIPLKNVKYN